MKTSVFISDPSYLWKAASSVKNRVVCVPECSPDIREEGRAQNALCLSEVILPFGRSWTGSI